MKRLDCPGSRMTGSAPADSYTRDDNCPMCGGLFTVNVDGAIRRHPMRYAKMLAHLSAVVRYERERTGAPQLRWSDGRCVA